MASDKKETLSHILNIVQHLNSEADLESCLRLILSAAAELTDSEIASLLKYDEVAQDLYFKYVPWFHREAIDAERVPLEGSVAGWAFLNAQPLIVNDAEKDSRHYKRIDHMSDFTTRSILAAPLFLRGKPVGVLEIFNKADDYTEADVTLAETLAGLAATAIDAEWLKKDVANFEHEARELDRMKSDFVAITSHELRTPLGLILGHSTFLKELIGEEYKEQVDVIIRNAARLKEIIESLSNVGNHEAGDSLVRPQKVSVARIISDTCLSFEAAAKERNIRLVKDLPADQAMWVDLDGEKISIVLSNLMKNAVAFTNEGGEIVVSGEQQEDYVKVAVKDNGIGIPRKDLARIFDRFYQVEGHLTRKHGGMGLGLSVAKLMVEMHGGRIWADSEEGKGSVFSFILPSRNELPTPPFAE
ncbi:MAG: GAF domain-containing sensor histidine kinase [Anaerolineales bacterium]|nr:GAF domain-containing sensor histidine kinase [Anaerolineales bacterium]